MTFSVASPVVGSLEVHKDGCQHISRLFSAGGGVLSNGHETVTDALRIAQEDDERAKTAPCAADMLKVEQDAEAALPAYNSSIEEKMIYEVEVQMTAKVRFPMTAKVQKMLVDELRAIAERELLGMLPPNVAEVAPPTAKTNSSSGGMIPKTSLPEDVPALFVTFAEDVK